MAIRIKPIQDSLNTPEDYRYRLQPFTQDESGIKALQSYFDGENAITRGGMYLLEILNNVISSTNDQKNTRVFRRIPSEIYSGWYEGGPGLRKASLICRANASERGDGSPQSERKEEKGSERYTVEQLRLGSWAERDGHWSDEPEQELLDKGYIHNPEHDGSESRVYYDAAHQKVHKTLDWTHYESFEKLLDKIAIHNSVFPEARLTVKGFGIRDDATDNTGFVAIINQPFIEGLREANKNEIEELLHERGFERTANGIWYISRDGNISLTDLGGGPFEELDEEFGFPLNALVVERDDGYRVVVVIDCDAYLKTFEVNSGEIQKVAMSDLAPGKNGRYDSEAWETILGEECCFATSEEKAFLYKELRTKGRISGTVNGNVVKMISPIPRNETIEGNTSIYYDDVICVGSPAAFREDAVYEIPPLAYTEERVERIIKEINYLLPLSVPAKELQDLAIIAGDEQFSKEQKEFGRVEGMIEDYIIQQDRTNPENVLILKREKAEFLVWATTNNKDLGVTFTDMHRKELAKGKTVKIGNKYFYLDIDRGKICQETNQKKLRLLTQQEKATKRQI